MKNDPEENDYFTLDPKGATSITFTATSGNRFVLFGVNAELFEAQDVEITTAKYATLGLPYAVTIPEGVSAYTATVSENIVTMTKISGTTIPANCGVILYAAEVGNYTFTPAANVDPITANKLVAVVSGPYTCTKADEGMIYYLGKDGEKATFKKLNENGTIAAGKAYLKLDEALSGNAKLDVTFGEPTGITSYENDNENENLKSMTVYNLNGMKVNEAYKGIVIMNGKKYINK